MFNYIQTVRNQKKQSSKDQAHVFIVIQVITQPISTKKSEKLLY